MARIIYDSELDESLKDIKEDVSPDYSAFNDKIPPPPPINIKGYGKNLIVETAPGSGKYKTQWGEEASPEYVKDIEDTLASDMSDEQLSAKIRKQVPQRPDDAKLAAWETKLKFRQMALESMKDHGLEVPDPWLEGEKAASEMKKHYYQGVSVHDQLLRTEKENAKINFDIEQARKIAVHNAKARIDDYIKQIDDHYDSMTKAEAEAARNEREKGEEQARHERDRKEKKEDSIDDRTKAYLQTLRSEQADIKKQMRGIGADLAKFGVADPASVPPTLAENQHIAGLVSHYKKLQEADEEQDSKINEIILNKPSEAKEIMEKKKAPKSHILSGMKSGRYRIGGKIVKWDGNREI